MLDFIHSSFTCTLRKLCYSGHRLMNVARNPVICSVGYCYTCDRNVKFAAYNLWLRDHFMCTNCGSIPRERALMRVIEAMFPSWRSAVVHESSPCARGASARLSRECAHYVASQYFSDQASGSLVGKIRNENLGCLTFGDESIDLHVTQDVLEHVFDSADVFREIARTLKPGGMHIFTVPLVNGMAASKPRAIMRDGSIEYIQPEQYHGNPIGNGKSLVTVDWGFDICQHIFDSSGLFTQIMNIDDVSNGIRAKYIEVLVTYKPEHPLSPI